MIDDLAFALEKHEQPAMAKAPVFPRDRHHPIPKITIIRAARLVSNGHAATTNGFTRPPFAHPVMRHKMRDSFPLGSGRHHFFPNRSFNATLSSIASANIRFSLPFSSSKARRRLASETSIPPNLAFHL